jgi:hypothetical protein
MANAKLRKKATDIQEGVGEVLDFIEAKPGKNRGMATTPLTGRFEAGQAGFKEIGLDGGKRPVHNRH